MLTLNWSHSTVYIFGKLYTPRRGSECIKCYNQLQVAKLTAICISATQNCQFHRPFLLFYDWQ